MKYNLTSEIKIDSYRESCPWIDNDHLEWTSQLLRSAVVWLSETVGKSILRLTDDDYREDSLGQLLNIDGSSYDMNIRVFNELQRTITGWPGGKPNADDTDRPERAAPYPKRVIVFSPHPDDDVISMGGTLQRLVRQGHEVHVAYQTSGNIAVNDEDVMKYMHFVNGFGKMLSTETGTEFMKQKYKEVKKFLSEKKPGMPDSADVLKIKALIRRGEARTACAYTGILKSHLHFLDLPFYETGMVEKLPISETDVMKIKELIDEVKPHQIYVAADLSDPHGTHRKCTDAVLAAIDMAAREKEPWVEDCRVWMYRGAWAEWDIENIMMAVPLSPEELRSKRNAILKHSSQMEFAPFLGNDTRLFWQRAEERNRATAALYHRLGFADYEAMEAFVEWKIK